MVKLVFLLENGDLILNPQWSQKTHPSYGLDDLDDQPLTP